ncbi:2393_t:CDS:2 [Ambispora gerdemannii]|uniref:2393_t:CDS:1 n=1 Tax=Ambispora gerdemannii TaxID=144530 RepID=A0A9N9EXG2_9GLOM|nr:2393_t:CDS:2 [Ambispora gerdemannii]
MAQIQKFTGPLINSDLESLKRSLGQPELHVTISVFQTVRTCINIINEFLEPDSNCFLEFKDDRMRLKYKTTDKKFIIQGAFEFLDLSHFNPTIRSDNNNVIQVEILTTELIDMVKKIHNATYETQTIILEIAWRNLGPVFHVQISIDEVRTTYEFPITLATDPIKFIELKYNPVVVVKLPDQEEFRKKASVFPRLFATVDIKANRQGKLQITGFSHYSSIRCNWDKLQYTNLPILADVNAPTAPDEIRGVRVLAATLDKVVSVGSELDIHTVAGIWENSALQLQIYLDKEFREKVAEIYISQFNDD